MKQMVLMAILAVAGNVVLAQQEPATPASAASMATAAVPNTVNPGVELRNVQSKLRPFEEKLVRNDPEIMALMQQRKDAYQAVLELDQKRMALLAAKLLADPVAAPLAKRRAELLEKLREMYPATAPAQLGTADGSKRLATPAPQASTNAP